MTFLTRGNLSEVNNLVGMLRMKDAWLFSLNVQDGVVAAPLKSRTPSVALVFSWTLVVIKSTAANDENDVVTEIQEIVTFDDNANVDKKELPNYVNIGAGIKDAAVSQRMHDIKNFLSRPIHCVSGSWSITDIAGTTITNMPMPSACFNSSEMIKEKLRGFYGFRARMKIRVQLNAQRFQQGRLILHWLPHISSPERVAHANSHLTFITQQPRIDLDARDSDVELIVPYVNPSLYYDLTTGQNPFGTFRISVYSPLVSVSGPTNVDYAVWCQFEDIEVVYPTVSSNILVAQSGKIRSRRGAGPGTINVTDAELNSQDLGPVSGFLSKVSTAAGIIGEIPVLSSVAAPASWVASVLSRSAQAMGFSKPTVESVSSKAMLSMFPGTNNSDMPDNSMKLSLSCSNKIQHLPGFAGTDIDEMSIQYLAQIPAFVNSYNWTTSGQVGVRLGYWKTNPCALDTGINSLSNYYTVTVSGVPYNIYRPTPVAYLGSMFRRWRGSVNYTFKFVKTEFHSGRLMFVFYPGAVSVQDVTFQKSQYCYRQVLDLREANEFTINVPYVSLRPWCDLPNRAFFEEPFGVVALFILNPLRAPETVSQSVDILLEVSGGHDTEFQWPMTAGRAPVLSTGIINTQMMSMNMDGDEESKLDTEVASIAAVEDSSEEVDEVPFRHIDEEIGTPVENVGSLQAQSGLSTGPSRVSAGLSSIPVNPQIDNDSSAMHIEPAAYCAGESITSLRQLVKRFSAFVALSSSTRAIYVFEPFCYSILGATNNSIALPASMTIDYVSSIACMYAFDRGGMRFKLKAGPSAATTYLEATIVPSGVGVTSSTPVTTSTAPQSIAGSLSGLTDNRVFALPTLNGGLEVEVPAYQRTHSRLARNMSGNCPPTARQLNDGDVYLLMSTRTAFTGFDLRRAASDDYSCGFFIGVPGLTEPSFVPEIVA